MNLLGGNQPVLPNARLAAHQAWYFAASGRPDMARAVAMDALSLAQKIPREKKSGGGYVDDEGAKLRATIEAFLTALGGDSVRLRNAWRLTQRRFFVQLAVVAVVVTGITSAVMNAQTHTYSPPRGPKPYLSEVTANGDQGKLTSPTGLPASNAAGTVTTRQPVAQASTTNAGTTAKRAWTRPAKAPNGQPWPSSTA